MADTSAKPILIAGAVATVALLGVAWSFTARVSEQAVIDARDYAEANSSPLITAVSTVGGDAELPAPEAEVAEAEVTEEEAVEAAEVEQPEETEVAEAEAEPAEAEEAQVAEAEPAQAEETEAAAAEAEPAETEVAEAEAVAAQETAAPEETETAAVEPAEVAETETAPAAAAPAAAPATLMASIDGDVVAGKRVFRKCQACHMIGDGATNRVGPQLNKIIGGVMGGVEGFNYSDGFQTANAEGRVWTVDEMSAWLEKPRDFMPGTKMAFAGLRKEEDRVNVIAYMADEGGVTEVKESSVDTAEETKVAAAAPVAVEPTAEVPAAAAEQETAAAETTEEAPQPAAEESAAAEQPQEAEVAEAEPAAAEETGQAVTEEDAAPAQEAAAAPAEEAAAGGAITLASLSGDPAAGKRVFRKCQACHQVGEDAKNRVGPQLNEIMGGVMGGVEGFNYSDGFQAANAEGRVWTVEEMSAWLAKPRDFMPGTKMAFAGLRKEEDRDNVIAYIVEQSQ